MKFLEFVKSVAESNVESSTPLQIVDNDGNVITTEYLVTFIPAEVSHTLHDFHDNGPFIMVSKQRECLESDYTDLCLLDEF